MCGHIKALHKKGKCMAQINRCGCELFETEKQADKPLLFSLKDRNYTGIYARSYQLEEES